VSYPHVPQEVVVSRVAVVVAVAGVAALVAGCGGSGQASPPPVAQSMQASLVAKGAEQVCDDLPPVASGMAGLKQPGFSELESYSKALGNLEVQAYQGADANADLANLLGEAATAMGEMAIASHPRFLAVARSEVRQAVRLCSAPRPGRDRD
jgi:hypothetical protein